MIQEGDILSGRKLNLSFPNTLTFTEGSTIVGSENYSIQAEYVENEYCTIGLYNSSDVLIDAFYTYDIPDASIVLNIPTYTLPTDFGIVSTVDAESGLLQYISAVFGQEVASDTINMATYLSTHNDAAKTATNYLSWISQQEGLVISENPVTDISAITGGNARINSNGMRVYDGTTQIAEFGQTVSLGDKSSTHTEINPGSYDICLGNGDPILHIETGTSSRNPHFSFGQDNTSSAVASFAEGIGVEAKGYASHAEGWETVAGVSNSSGLAAHAEGYKSQALGSNSHAQNYNCVTEAPYSHVGGHSSEIGSSGWMAFAHGTNLSSNTQNQTVFGKFNDNQTYNALEVGWGTSDSDRKNILELRNNGNLTVTGEVHGSNIFKLAHGEITDNNAPANGYQSIGPVSYSSTGFTSAPHVIIGFKSSSTASGFGRCSCSVYNVTATSFYCRIFNADTTSRSPDLEWIAIGT